MNKDYTQLKWLCRLHFSDYDDSWYLSLFDGMKEGTIKGEITPSYSMLKEADVGEMHQLVPHVKIIFILRNRIDRAWSHYQYACHHYSHIKDIRTSDWMMQFFDRSSQELRSDYLRTLDVYTKYYPKDQIIIGFYDAVRDSPQHLLSDIVTFLGGTQPVGVKKVERKSQRFPEDRYA